MSNIGSDSNSTQVSMDEILTSIRETIGNKQHIEKKNPLSPSKLSPPTLQDGKDDVLELTHPLEDPSMDIPKSAKSIPSPQKKSCPPPSPSQDTLVSDNVFSKAAIAFEALSEAVRNKEILEEHQGAGGQRVDDLMKEIMRPYIKNWLDQNLPSLVERLVQKEIAKLVQSTEISPLS